MIRDVLPSTVREQLARSGRIDHRAIEELMVPERQQQRFGLYAAMKAANGEIDLQHDMVKRFVIKDADFSQVTREDIEPVLQMMREKDMTIAADKLAEISRKGFDNWVDFFMDRFAQIVPQDAPVYLLAHSPSICLDRILQSRGRVNLLLPTQFESEGTVGFDIDVRNQNTSLLAHDFARPEGAILVDDIRNTGVSEEKAKDFWGEKNPPSLYLPMAAMQNHDGASSRSVTKSET